MNLRPITAALLAAGVALPIMLPNILRSGNCSISAGSTAHSIAGCVLTVRERWRRAEKALRSRL